MSKPPTKKPTLRNFLFLARLLCVMFLMSTSMFAASAPIVLAQLEVPDGAIVPPPPAEPINPSAQVRINQSLDRETQSSDQFPLPEPSLDATGNARPTGDPVLDEVLDIIRRRGSVLRGSQLDSPDQPLQMPRIAIFETEDPIEFGNASNNGSELGRSSPGYLAAEQLLRSARSLEKLNATNERYELIRAMRSHAAKLLIDAISQETQTRRP